MIDDQKQGPQLAESVLNRITMSKISPQAVDSAMVVCCGNSSGEWSYPLPRHGKEQQKQLLYTFYLKKQNVAAVVKKLHFSSIRC